MSEHDEEMPLPALQPHNSSFGKMRAQQSHRPSRASGANDLYIIHLYVSMLIPIGPMGKLRLREVECLAQALTGTFYRRRPRVRLPEEAIYIFGKVMIPTRRTEHSLKCLAVGGLV